MSAFKSLLIGAILVQSAVAAGNGCPNNWSSNQIGNDDTTYCCYGSSVITNGEGYCCINAVNSSGGSDWLPDDQKDCFPFCDVKAKRADTASCVHKAYFTASDYSEQVSSASKSVNAAATKTGSNKKPAKTAATATSEGSVKTTATTPGATPGATGVITNNSDGKDGEDGQDGKKGSSSSDGGDGGDGGNSVSSSDGGDANSNGGSEGNNSNKSGDDNDNAAMLLSGDSIMKYGGALAAAALLAL